jgi:alkanesulfonate monooxygenase SsuD/methylene tetrahydromethanopterin reductase-like flavin-dependent oxidoreductase (luciferase family)
MRIGSLSLWGDRLEEFRREVRLAAELGYEVVSVGETPFTWRDMYVTLAVATHEAPGVTLASMVTTPLLHHPVTNAIAMSSLYDLAGGRVVLALGTGGSVATGLGRKAATQAELRDYLLATRRLFAGEGITWNGSDVKPLRFARPVPIYLTANGPKTLRLAGALADGVIIEVGSSMESADRRIALVREGAEQAGRDPDEIDYWATSFFSIRDTRDQAVADILSFLASAGVYRLRLHGGVDDVPGEVGTRIAELRRRYEVSAHAIAGGHNAKLVEELGLAEFLVGVSAIAGTPDEVSAKIAELGARGVSCLICPVAGNADPGGTLERFAAARDRL